MNVVNDTAARALSAELLPADRSGDIEGTAVLGATVGEKPGLSAPPANAASDGEDVCAGYTVEVCATTSCALCVGGTVTAVETEVLHAFACTGSGTGAVGTTTT